MQRRFTTQKALELILSNASPCDSDGEDIDLQLDSDSELSSAFPIKDSLLFPAIHCNKTGQVWHQVLGGLQLEIKPENLGTVKKSRREIPQYAREMDRTEFTTQVFSTTGATLTVYAPKWRKAVYVLSSMHSVVETEDTTKQSAVWM
ncbi:hypothetical protein MHYP_G00207980 [Metynnis hypsauchen]